MDRLKTLNSNRIANQIRKPQILLFVFSLLIISVACYPQLEFLYNDYWVANSRLSKGPFIWIISVAVIFHTLSGVRMKTSTSNVDIAVALTFLAVLTAILKFDPLVAPTILVIFAWYMLTARPDLMRMLIVWIFLLFSLPYYSQWIAGLQMLTVNASESMLGFLGIPVLVQEFTVAIPRGQFIIAEGCSGARYLTSNLLLLFLYSILSRFGIRQFLLGLLATVTLGLLVNWIRVVSIISFAQSFGIEHSFVQDHEDFGWLLYALQLIPLFYLLMKVDNTDWQAIQIKRPPESTIFPFPALTLILLPLLFVTWQP